MHYVKSLAVWHTCLEICSMQTWKWHYSPSHINSAHFFFLMHLLHLMAHQQLLFKAWELLLSFSISLSLTGSAPPWLLIHPVQRGIYHTMVWLSHFQVSNQIPVHHTVMTETKKADICHKDRWRGRFTLCILVWKNRKHYSFCRKEDIWKTAWQLRLPKISQRQSNLEISIEHKLEICFSLLYKLYKRHCGHFTIKQKQ